MPVKRRTSVRLDESLLRKARKALKASTNAEAITRALQEAVLNRQAEHPPGT